MSEQDFIFPPGSTVVLKQATIITRTAWVIYNYQPTLLGTIWSQVMTNFEGKELPKEKLWQFYIKASEIVIGSKVMYGSGANRKPANVIGMDRSNKYSDSKSYVTLEFAGNHRRTVPYNGCYMEGETLVPIDFSIYHKLWDQYQWRSKGSQMKEGKLPFLIAPYYNVKHIDGVLFASDPVKPEIADISSNGVDIHVSPDPPKAEEIPAYYVQKDKKIINLAISISDLEEQLSKQGYIITKAII